MDTYTTAAAILTLAVFIGYINHQFIRLQSTIAIMSGAILLSLILLVLQHLGLSNIAQQTKTLVIKADFNHLLINGMLSFLLFAGALTIDLNALKSNKWEVATLATIGTILSAFIISSCVYYFLPLLGLHLPYLYCLLFGSLISPTDPIAVLAIFKEIGAPKKLEVCVAGESLFNDGVGIVLFVTLYQLTFQGIPVTLPSVVILFSQQALGGIAYGAALGLLANYLIEHAEDPKIAVLVTLAMVTGGYSIALALNLSGALAMVVAGIFVGDKIRRKTHTQLRVWLDLFWELIDEILNAVLFLLIGLELLTIKATSQSLLAAVLIIPLVLLVRLITVAIPMKFFQLRRSQTPYTISVLTWGGLRGGLAVALALSLPHNAYRDLILTLTYAVVAFAVIVQGLTIKPLAKLAKQAERYS